MKLTFLGTRGYIKPATRRHRRHSALLVEYYGRRLMVDCGEDWRGRLSRIAPHAIVVTHAHPDHAFALKGGAPCPVYATEAAWQTLSDFPIDDRRCMPPREPQRIEGIRVEAFPVVHSLRAPAVGYRIGAGRAEIFYVPDVIDVKDRKAALDGVRVYIGDGASMTRPMVRRHGDKLFGHTTVRAQLGWCAEAGVPRAIFTHCGSGIVSGDERKLAARLRRMARQKGAKRAEIAHDGMTLVLR
jgi:phosphoribosyl 1,2-cyclic phosphodiesterase